MIDGKTQTEIEFPCPFCRKIIAVRSNTCNYVSVDYNEKYGHHWTPIDNELEEFLNDRQENKNSPE